MTDHSPLQTELAIRAAATDVAKKRLTKLSTRKAELAARVHELVNAAVTARTALRDAAGASAAGEGDPKTVERARKALRDAEAEAELASIELEGIEGWVTKAEREHAAARRDFGLAGVDVIAAAIGPMEEQIRADFSVFAQRMRHRHELAKLASVLASEASGHASEPFPWSSPTSGLLRRSPFDEGFAGVLRDAGLTAEFYSPTGAVSPATIDDLLELELELPAQTAKAAE